MTAERYVGDHKVLPRYVVLVADEGDWRIEHTTDDYTAALIEHSEWSRTVPAFVADAQEHDDAE